MQRLPFDVTAYERRVRRGGCFICAIVRGDPRQDEHVIYRDETAIALLSRYPTLRGYSLVAPIRHRERVVADFDRNEYLALQAVVHRLGVAIGEVLPTERLYVLSLGSQQGNRHVHWHVAPLPPGVPYEQQQYAALMAERSGYLDIRGGEQAGLAARIGAAMRRTA